MIALSFLEYMVSKMKNHITVDINAFKSGYCCTST